MILRKYFYRSFNKMTATEFCCHNEADVLRRVIIGSWEGYRQSEFYIEKVNAVQEQMAAPARDLLKDELEGFKSVLESMGVEVLVPRRVGKIVYDQLTPRDIGVVIGDRFVLCNMRKQSRRYECVGIFDLIMHYDLSEPNILIPPADCFIEGGDVIVDKQTIYIGISERTNRQAVEFIRKNFGDRFRVVPVTLAPSTEENLYLHLDCVFNPVGKRHALIHAPGIQEVPAELSGDYELIEISAAEQAALCTNVLSLSHEVVISRDHDQCARVNAELRKICSVIEVPFNAVPLTGGSLRCSSLPLQRKKMLTA